MIAKVARKWRGAEFGIDGDEVGNDAADTEPGEKPQPGQLRQIGGIGGRVSERAEQDVRQNECGLAAVTVADPAENLRAEQHADIARAQDEAECLRLNVPFGDQMRRRKGDGADIVAVDHRQEHGPDDQLDLERAEPVFVQKLRNLNLCLAGHRSPRRFLLWRLVASAGS